MMVLSQRHLQPEWMDRPDCDRELHREALHGLATINWWSGSARLLWPSIKQCALKNGRIRILDLACGGGDVTVRLAQIAKQQKIPLAFAGCDRSQLAVDLATERTRIADLDIEFWRQDVLLNDLPGDFDIVMCSLFMHHLEHADAVKLLRCMAEATRSLVLVNDLRRSTAGYLLALGGVWMLSRSAVVRFDGPVSVQGAFTIREMHQLATSAGLTGARVMRRWPQRFLMQWTRPQS